MNFLDRLKGGFRGFVDGFRSQPNLSEETRRRLAVYVQRHEQYKGFRTASMVGMSLRPIRSKTRRLAYNFARPICNIGGAWAAGEAVTWKITGDSPEATKTLSQQAADIWERSLGDAELMIASVTAAVIGDMCPAVRWDKAKKQSRIEFVHPSLCEPVSDPDRIDQLSQLRITFPANAEGHQKSETWTKDEVTFRTLDKEGRELSSEVWQHALGLVPAAWLPNQALASQMFGDSEHEAAWDAIVEFDHINGKQSRIIDYHEDPVIVLEGMLGNAQTKLQKEGNATVLRTPAATKAYYLEHAKDAPAVDSHLARIHSAICELSETPPIAFGEVDRGFTNATGISLKVLYGPLNAKTKRKRAIWGPRLEGVMRAALLAEGIAVEPEQVHMEWQNMMPSSDLEQMQVYEAEKRLGVSETVILRRMGHDDDAIKEMQTENQAAADAEFNRRMATFDRGLE